MKPRGPSIWPVLGHLLPAFLVAAIFAAVGILHVSSRVLVVRSGYRLSELEAESRVLIRENDRLELELATLKSPARLERIAREDLEMIPAPPHDVVTLLPPTRLGRLPVRVRPETAANVRAEAAR